MRLKGFTLIEILIAMLLSSILLALAVEVILHISSIGILQNKTSKQNYNVVKVYSVLKENFQNAILIKVDRNNDLSFSYSDGSKVKITFDSSMVIVSGINVHDTIPLPWEGLKIDKLDSVSGLVSGISFRIRYNDLQYPIIIIKDYPQQVLYSEN